MDEYRGELSKIHTGEFHMGIKNLDTESLWSNYLINKTVKEGPDTETLWAPPSRTNSISLNIDKLLVANDTGSAFGYIEAIYHILLIFHHVTSRNQLLRNRGKVFRHQPAKIKYLPILIKNMPHPFKTIKCVNKGKILGHITEPNFKTHQAVNAGISKINASTYANRKLKLILLRSLVFIVLLYGLRITPLTNTIISILQLFFSRCIRFLLQGRHSDVAEKAPRNSTIWDNYDIPTVASRLKKLRYRTYITWEDTLSAAHLNNEEYIYSRQIK